MFTNLPFSSGKDYFRTQAEAPQPKPISNLRERPNSLSTKFYDGPQTTYEQPQFSKTITPSFPQTTPMKYNMGHTSFGTLPFGNGYYNQAANQEQNFPRNGQNGVWQSTPIGNTVPSFVTSGARPETHASVNPVYNNGSTYFPMRDKSVPKNVLSSELSRKVIAKPGACSCRRGARGGCESAEDWMEYIISGPDDELRLRSAYDAIQTRPINPDDQKQIENDSTRTFPELEIYKSGTPDSKRLCRMLNAVAIHFHHLGYVQGMNFIMAAFYYHVQDEAMTFWLFCYLVDYLNLHKIYEKGSLLPDPRFAWSQVSFRAV